MASERNIWGKGERNCFGVESGHQTRGRGGSRRAVRSSGALVLSTVMRWMVGGYNRRARDLQALKAILILRGGKITAKTAMHVRC